MDKPLKYTRPSDNEYCRSIQDLSLHLQNRLGVADYDAVEELCEMIYKTGYLDGFSDAQAYKP